MNERYILLSLRTKGLKCLDKPIEIQFANKKVDEDYSLPYVKAIYGANGEGKTAIAHALDLYRSSVLVSGYLIGQSYIGGFEEIINQTLKEALIDVYFARCGESGIKLYHHIINYRLSGKTLKIQSEELYQCKGSSWGNVSQEELLYSTYNGSYTSINKKAVAIKDDIIAASANMLTNVSAALPIFSAKQGRNNLLFDASFDVLRFASSIRVFFDQSDRHGEDDSTQELLGKSNFRSAESPTKRIYLGVEQDQVKMEDLPDYEVMINRITGFLKVFKTDLASIEIEKSFVRDACICRKILVYEDGSKVSLEYESSGIKKLFRLYSYLDNVEEGGISFIDEFDSNIHDVYLCKLIEYFSTMASGQLIFTVHNLGPMETLSNIPLKHTIDFLSDSDITSWKRNGNYSVVRLYRSGAIDRCLFSIDAATFVNLFGRKA